MQHDVAFLSGIDSNTENNTASVAAGASARSAIICASSKAGGAIDRAAGARAASQKPHNLFSLNSYRSRTKKKPRIGVITSRPCAAYVARRCSRHAYCIAGAVDILCRDAMLIRVGNGSVSTPFFK